MRGLLDVNVLIALLDSDHVAHRSALDWFSQQDRAGWASCPITQNGCIRIMSHPRYANPVPVPFVVERLGEATAHPLHEFWPDDLSVLDATRVDPARIHGAQQLTDTYLLALAVAHGGRLVTYDRRVSIASVRQASAEHLLQL
ncbi:MAG: PIN domain-containing protein [Pseudomonadales bacterium]|nr:PIN domain-containing protein [Pseudomonadales bacterium]